MTANFRALCAELVSLQGHLLVEATEEWDEAISKIRAALAANPGPAQAAEGGPDSLLVRYCVTWSGAPPAPLLTPMPDGYWTPWHLADALLRCTTHPVEPPAPVPVAERLPGDGDCNKDGEVWVQEGGIHEQFFDESEWMPFAWVLREYSESDARRKAPWLPHWALPLPATPQPEQL